MSTKQWRMWPRGEEGSPETQGKYTDRYEHVHFTATSGLPAVAEGMCWERSDSLSGDSRRALKTRPKISHHMAVNSNLFSFQSLKQQNKHST